MFGMSGRMKPGDREARRAAAVQLFVRRYGRVAGTGGRDANDRTYDRRVARAVRRMSPERFDALLRFGDADEPGSAGGR